MNRRLFRRGGVFIFGLRRRCLLRKSGADESRQKQDGQIQTYDVVAKPPGTRASRPQSLGKCGQDARVPGKAGGFAITSEDIFKNLISTAVSCRRIRSDRQRPTRLKLHSFIKNYDAILRNSKTKSTHRLPACANFLTWIFIGFRYEGAQAGVTTRRAP